MVARQIVPTDPLIVGCTPLLGPLQGRSVECIQIWNSSGATQVMYQTGSVRQRSKDTYSSMGMCDAKSASHRRTRTDLARWCPVHPIHLQNLSRTVIMLLHDVTLYLTLGFVLRVMQYTAAAVTQT